MRDLLARPEAPQELEPLVEHGGTHLRVGRLPELVELRCGAAQARAERDAAAAEVVERRDLMGQHVRPSPGDRGDRRAQAHALGRCCDRGQHRPRIGRGLSPCECKVVPDKHAVPAARVRGLSKPHRHARVRIGADVRQANSVTHSGTLEPPDGRAAPVSASRKEAATGIVSRLRRRREAMAGVAAADIELAETLGAGFRGRLIGSDDSDYDTARKLYNAMIDKRPRLIAQCVDAADVIAAVNVAREAGLDLAVRCGAHNGPGLGSVDDGLVIDLSALRGVIIDPDARIAHVLGGTLLGEVDHATQPFGLAAPFGIISTTGVGGLTLGGGVGHMTRKLGLSIDNLIEAVIVLADGSFVTANEDRHPDLLWALRGGGGNFGVVTRFAFRLSPLSTVVAGPMLWPLERSAEILW